MKIIIGADLVPTQSNEQLFFERNVNVLLGKELTDLLSQASFKIFNLEVPLTDAASPIEKCGPALIASPASVGGIKAIGANLLTIANNHILDQGEQGLFSTTELLKSVGIDYVGAGADLDAASKPYIAQIGDKCIGIYACAENEFSIATTSSAGANPFDPFESFDHVASLKGQCDYVIVLYHGGKEHYRYPSPMLQKTCRKLAEKGADLVICQHSHCVGCMEEYNGATIVYGQGNFLFDHSESEFWQTGLLIETDENFHIEYIPIKKMGNTVRLAVGDDAKNILGGFARRSQQIQVPGFVEENYKAFAESMLPLYLFTSSGKNRSLFYRVINKLTGHKLEKALLNRRYNGQKCLNLQNYIECEAHRELFLCGLKQKTNRR